MTSIREPLTYIRGDLDPGAGYRFYRIYGSLIRESTALKKDGSAQHYSTSLCCPPRPQTSVL